MRAGQSAVALDAAHGETRAVSGGSFADLNEDLLGDETLVAYAAAGTTAAGGRGRNRPYTAALLSHLETPLKIGWRCGCGTRPVRERPARDIRLSAKSGQPGDCEDSHHRMRHRAELG